MSMSLTEYSKGAIKPVQCLQEGWAMIKEQYWLFFGITLVGILIASAVPLGILLGPMMCGINLCLFRRRRREPVTFDLLFKGFDYFVESLIATLVQIVPIFALIIPFYIFFFIGMMSSIASQARTGAANQPPVLPAAFLLMSGALFFIMIFLLTLVAAFFIFTFPLMVDRKLSGLNAIKLSMKAVTGNLGGVFGLMLLNFVLGLLGMLLCYVGVFLFMPVGLAAWVVAYEQVFGLRPDAVL